MNKYIGSLWLKEANGKQYFSGVITDLRGDINIVIFPNNRKEKANQPDYNILLSEPKKPETQSQFTPQGFTPAQPQTQQQTTQQIIKNSEIPVIQEGVDDGEIDVKNIPF